MANSSGAELSAPVAREAQHFRNYAFGGYRRADGLFDIEGRMTDTKSYAFPNDWRSTIEAGEPLHDMRIRLTLDEEFVIREVECVTAAGPVRDLPRHHAGLRRAQGRAHRPRLVARAAREVRRPSRLRASCRDAARDGDGGVPDALWLAGTAQARGRPRPGRRPARAASRRRDASRASSIPATRWPATARWCARSTRSSTRRGSRRLPSLVMVGLGRHLP